MTAQLARGAACVAPVADRSIDDLDLEICRLVRHMNAETYRMLRLVRDFDDRFGFAKWGFASCAEWLAWRCGLSLSAAREKVRTAQALRALPAISAAFADGRLSYSKVRALTRVAALHDEDLLLAYALEATASQVEERCRQIRNVEPDSVHAAKRAWERRSLTLFRDRSRGVVRITVELPEAEGELVGRALENAVAAGDVAMRRRVHIERGACGGRLAGAAGRCARRDRQGVSRRECECWRKSLRGGRCGGARCSVARPLPITVKSSCMSTSQPSAEGWAGRICRSTPSSASPATLA